MNRKMRSISFNSVSPFRKKSPPLKKVPLSFGVNMELQKKNLQFYNQFNEMSTIDNHNNSNNMNIKPQMRNESAIQYLNEDNRIIQTRNSSINNNKIRQFGDNDQDHHHNLANSHIKTNQTNDGQSRNVNSKLSNYSTQNSKPILPTYQRLIKSRASANDSFILPSNLSFISKEQNPQLLLPPHPQQFMKKEPTSFQRNNSHEITTSLKPQQKQKSLILSTRIDHYNNNLQQMSGGNIMNQQNNMFEEHNKHSNRQQQQYLQKDILNQQQSFNPTHYSFYHNTNINQQKQQLKKKDNIRNHSLIIHDNSNNNQKINPRQSLLDQSHSNNNQPLSSRVTINNADKSNKTSQNNTIQVKQDKTNIQTGLTIPKGNTNNKNKKYKKLQDPDKILKYIEDKEIGFDTTEDILKAVNIAQNNTDEQLINKRRQPLAPLPQRSQEKQPHTNVKHIQKFDLTFNQIDDQQLQNYIQQKDHFLNQIEITRYNERYQINKEVDSSQKKKKKKNNPVLDTEELTNDNHRLSFSQFNLIKTQDSPVISHNNNQNNNSYNNNHNHPKIAISTKQSSFEYKYGGIQPIKKYYKDFDDYSVEQKNIMRTQEQSPLNNGFSRKIEKMKKQNDQLSRITHLLHQIQRDDPII